MKLIFHHIELQCTEYDVKQKSHISFCLNLKNWNTAETQLLLVFHPCDFVTNVQNIEQ